MINLSHFPTPQASKYFIASRMWQSQCRSMSTSDFIRSYEKVQRLSREARIANRRHFDRKLAAIKKREPKFPSLEKVIAEMEEANG